MTEPESVPPVNAPAERADALEKMRKLLHDMNNGLEVILQANYLLGTVEMDESGRQWLKLLAQGVEQVTALSCALRVQIHRFDDV